VRAAWLKGRPYDADKLGRPQWAGQVPLLSFSLRPGQSSDCHLHVRCALTANGAHFYLPASKDAHDYLISMVSGPQTRRAHAVLIRHIHNCSRVCRRRRKRSS